MKRKVSLIVDSLFIGIIEFNQLNMQNKKKVIIFLESRKCFVSICFVSFLKVKFVKMWF